MVQDIAFEIKHSAVVGAALDEVTDNATKNYMGVLIFTLNEEFVRKAWCVYVYTWGMHNGRHGIHDDLHVEK